MHEIRLFLFLHLDTLSVVCGTTVLASLYALLGKTPEEIRKTFNIKNDFTPEEEEQVNVLVILNTVEHFWAGHVVHYRPLLGQAINNLASVENSLVSCCQDSGPIRLSVLYL